MPAESLGLQTESVRLAEELHGLAGDFKYFVQRIDLGNDSSNTYPISTGRRFVRRRSSKVSGPRRASLSKHFTFSKQKSRFSQECTFLTHRDGDRDTSTAATISLLQLVFASGHSSILRK